MRDDFLAVAWTLVTDAKALEKHYKAAPKSVDVGLALARYVALRKDGDAANDVLAALRAERGECLRLIAPLLLSRCYTEDHAWTVTHQIAGLEGDWPAEAAPALEAFYQHLEQKIQKLRSNKKTAHDAEGWIGARTVVAGCLAELGHTQHAEALAPAAPELAENLLRRGIGVAEAVAQLDSQLKEGQLRSAADLMDALARAGVKEAVPSMLAFLRTGIFMHACAALARLGDARAKEPARAMLRESCGDVDDVAVLRMSCEHLLRALGEKLPLDGARANVYRPIVRYRTDEPETILMRVMAVTDLAKYGNADDKALAKKQIQSPFRLVREAAMLAFDTPPALVSWDPGRVAWAHESGGTKALLPALESPLSIHREHAIAVLAKDEKLRDKVARHIVETFEERMASPFFKESFFEMDPDLEEYAKVGKSLAKGPAKKIFEASQNMWLRTRVLGEEAEGIPSLYEIDARGGGSPSAPAKVERFDAPPYVFAGGATHVALAGKAERVLVVGAEIILFDPQASVRLLSLGDGSDVTACAIALDGNVFALARKNKITVHAADGAISARLEIKGAASAMALSEDATRLACGTAEGTVHVLDIAGSAEVFDGKAPGHVRGAGWLSAKRAVFLADHGKKSALVDVDVAKKKSANVPIPPSFRMATHRNILATAGAKRASIHDSKLAPKLSIDTEHPIVDMAIESEKSMYLAFAARLHVARVGGKTPKLEHYSNDAPTRLVAVGNRAYGLLGNKMVRFHQDPDGIVAAGVHYSHVCVIRPLPDGGLVSTGWAGRVLRWNKNGGIAETLFDRKSRIDDMALSPDAKTIYFGDGYNLRAIDLASGEMTCLVGGEEVEADLAEHMPEVAEVAASQTHVAWVERAAIHIVDRATGEETGLITAKDIESLACDDQGRFYAGSDNGTLACFDAKGNVLWKRSEHGADMLRGQLYGNPHRSVAWLTTRGKLLASLASDHTVRVFDLPDATRRLKVFRHVGIFNTVDISPDQKRIAFTFGATLEVWTLDGTLLTRQSEWPAPVEAMAVAWADDRTLFMGTGDGAIYRVTL